MDVAQLVNNGSARVVVDLGGRSSLLCGERVAGAVRVVFADGARPTDDDARTLSARVESLVAVPEGGGDSPGRMRSAEALFPPDCADADTRVGFVDGRDICVPFLVTAETDVPGTRYDAVLRVAVLQARADDRLARIAQTSSSAGRVLQRVLRDTAAAGWAAPLASVAAVAEARVRLVRPLAGDLDYVRLGEDALLFSVRLRALDAVAGVGLRLAALSFSLGPCFGVRPVSLPLPADLASGSVYGAAFEAVLLPQTSCVFSSVHARLTARLESGALSGCTLSLSDGALGRSPCSDAQLFASGIADADNTPSISVSIYSDGTEDEQQIIADVLPDRAPRNCPRGDAAGMSETSIHGGAVEVAFETDVDLSRALARPQGADCAVCVTVCAPPGACVRALAPFALGLAVRASTAPCDLVVRVLDEARAGHVRSASVLSANGGHSESGVSEGAEYAVPSLVSLDRETAVGRLAPGETAVAHVRLLALAAGRLRLPGLSVRDRLSGACFELRKLAPITVLPSV